MIRDVSVSHLSHHSHEGPESEHLQRNTDQVLKTNSQSVESKRIQMCEKVEVVSFWRYKVVRLKTYI